MKQALLIIACLTLILNSSMAQLNMTLESNFPYPVVSSDIWGYADGNGREYAIVGIENGVSFVDITDPQNPIERDFIPGQNTIWRDIKVWEDHAYITSDQTSEGLLVVDMSSLPDSTEWYYWNPLVDGIQLTACHNLYIDERGYCYLAGCVPNAGGMIILDVFTDPSNPQVAGLGPRVYSHDVYVRDSLMYSADIDVGYFSVSDVRDVTDIEVLATQNTPFFNTHNIWLSDDSQYAYTTDETSNAPVTSYDISDLSDIKELDQFRPQKTLGSGVIPHNVLVWNDWLVISYYTDGCIVVDAHKPDNLVEVGNFDTFLSNGGGFNGAWGVYPFLPSGLVIVSDVNTGLYVFSPNYVRASYLEGVVLDASDDQPLGNATIRVEEIDLSDQTNVFGSITTGAPFEGDYEMIVRAPGYFPDTITISLTATEVFNFEVKLEPIPPIIVIGSVRDESGNPIEGAQVNFSSSDFEYNAVSLVDGSFGITGFIPDDYDVITGKWGFLEKGDAMTIDTDNNIVDIVLSEGYQDGFANDLGWSISGLVNTGQWERGEPIGININGLQLYPEEDSQNDIGDKCYITANNPNFGSTFLTGETILTSPEMDLSNYQNPYLNFEYYFLNITQMFGPGDDSIRVHISDGIDSVEVKTIGWNINDFVPNAWLSESVRIADYLEPSANMKVTFSASNFNFQEFTDVGIDHFQIVDSIQTSIEIVGLDDGKLRIFPNPTSSLFQVHMDLDSEFDNSRFVVRNLLGQEVFSADINHTTQKLSFGQNLNKGLYFATVENSRKRSKPIKILKH